MKQLQAAAHVFSDRLALPDKVLRANDELILIYEKIGKPMSAHRNATVGERRVMAGFKHTIVLWLRQFGCALEGLQLLHENGYTCGCFSDEVIHYMLDEPSAVLAPYDIRTADVKDDQHGTCDDEKNGTAVSNDIEAVV